MKKIVLFLIVSLQLISIYSQKLSLSQILSLKTKTSNQINECLTSKSWVGLNSDKKLKYSYYLNKTKDSSEDIEIQNLPDIDEKIIYIRVYENGKYNNYINSIKSMGCRLLVCRKETGVTVEIFKNKSITFMCTVGKKTNGKLLYQVMILSNEVFNALLKAKKL